MFWFVLTLKCKRWYKTKTNNYIRTPMKTLHKQTYPWCHVLTHLPGVPQHLPEALIFLQGESHKGGGIHLILLTQFYLEINAGMKANALLHIFYKWLVFFKITMNFITIRLNVTLGWESRELKPGFLFSLSHNFLSYLLYIEWVSKLFWSYEKVHIFKS